MSSKIGRWYKVATSVGQIGLDLVVNQKQFNKQMTGVRSLATKVGKALAAAFAVKKVIDFGKECINLGSDLQEVQNVVDVTFPSMTEKVDTFAKSAAASFGLSETMAKRFTGTFGSMAKAFGFTESKAFEMGSTLTGLAGDIASFYNITQDEAYTKLKSVFTGETEALKDLGVVMTQSALDAHALANGFGKTTKSMTEAEKVALRYSFVQDQLSAAQGDFARTSDGWANQVRVLNLQFDSLKATIGQGLIAAFTPVLKIINTLLQRVQVLATAFKDLMEGIFGKQTTETDALSSAAKAASQAADDTAISTGITANNSKKASKYLLGFDVINKASETSADTSSSTSIGINTGSVQVEKNTIEASDGMVGKFQGVLKFLGEKFTPSFGRIWSKLETPINDFGENFSRVFTDLQTLAQPLVNYLTGPFLNYTTTVFETAGTIAAGLLDSFNTVFNDIWNIVIFPFLQKLIEEWLPGFTDFGTQVIEFSGEIFGELKKGFDTVWEEAAIPFLVNISEVFWSFMDLLEEFWNEYGQPIFNNLQEAFRQVSLIIETQWENCIKPIFDKIMEVVDEIWNNHLSPLEQNILEMVGELVNGGLRIYNEFIAPIVTWLSEKFGPAFYKVFSYCAEFVGEKIGYIIDFINGIITVLKGIIQFITGVFTGDWDKAWTGIKNIFKGVFESLVALVSNPVNAIIDAINAMVRGIVAGVNAVIRAVNSISFDMPEWLGGGHVGFNLKEFTAPEIPKLAQGGFVKANTPQLAVIGDNRHQGEVVAPEGKLLEMAKLAAGAGGNPELLKKIIELLGTLISLVQDGDDIVLNVDSEELARAVQTGSIRLKRRYTTVEVTV